MFSNITWDSGGLTVYFNNCEQPWSITEFTPGGEARRLLDELEEKLLSCTDTPLETLSGKVHLRICLYKDGTARYWAWNFITEDYEAELSADDALRAIASGATAEMAVVNPDDEYLPSIQQPVYETMPFDFMKL